MIDTGTGFAVCLVKPLFHTKRKTPTSAARYVMAVLPDDVSREMFHLALYAGLDDLPDVSIAQAFG